MRELNVKEIQEVSGGPLPLVVAIPAAYAVRKYGGRAAMFAVGAVVAWFAE